MATTTLNIIGCGRVGRALGRLWAHEDTFEIRDVLDRRLEQSLAAVEFMSHGRAVDAGGQMRCADVWMLSPPDDQILTCCAALAQSGVLAAGNIVFHCSGALPSSELDHASKCGAAVASVHPLKSFADPAIAAQTFSGTYCAAEGDAAALAVLRPAFERVGGIVSDIDPGFKPIYHAASVIVCNYLTALLETGLRCYEKSGFERDTALRMIEPLVRETLDNVFNLGTVRALTGPIARGDVAVVTHQVEALGAWDPRVAAIYKQLGAIAVELACAQGKADADALAALERLLPSGK